MKYLLVIGIVLLLLAWVGAMLGGDIMRYWRIRRM